jgi:hypothetical protein
MEKINFEYSKKNIPVPSRKMVEKALIKSGEKLTIRMRWRAQAYLKKFKKNNNDTFGFNTSNTPGPVLELVEFEEAFIELIRNIKFNNHSNEFLRKLARDKKDIQKEPKLLIAADKTTNIYKVEPEVHDKLIDEAITKTYKKAKDGQVKKMIKDDKKIAENLEIADRVHRITTSDAYITLKDHKDNFANNPKVRLINPTKSEIGKIAKKILENVVNVVKSATKLSLWKSTSDVITWYKEAENKDKCSFIEFDVVEFYPSITEYLLKAAIEWVKTITDISEEEVKVVMQAKRSLLSSKGQIWTKQGEPFDVTMGSYDGAETCEVVGLYLLSQMVTLNVAPGLYRDDGLVLCKGTPSQIEKTKKKIEAIYRKNNLKITIVANSKIVNFLDVTFNLNTCEYCPYMKPGNTPLYIHMDSNHPPSIVKNIPLSINRRLSSISSNKEAFDRAKKPYQDALMKSGYTHILSYEEVTVGSKKRSRQRNITYFNPPYSVNVETNIGKKFLDLVDRCFPPRHKLRSIFNRNTLKLSYSCMPSMGSAITGHNSKILNEKNNPTAPRPSPTPPTALTQPPPPPPAPTPPPSRPATRSRNPISQPTPPPITPPTQPTTPQPQPQPPIPPHIRDLGHCNCRVKAKCPIPGYCTTKGICYQATVIEDISLKTETYVGLTDGSFKARYANHMTDFTHSAKRGCTTLAGHIWRLQDAGLSYTIKWSILKQVKSFSPVSGKCDLCLTEKHLIIFSPELASLNQRNELSSACRHRAKFLLAKN